MRLTPPSLQQLALFLSRNAWLPNMGLMRMGIISLRRRIIVRLSRTRIRQMMIEMVSVMPVITTMIMIWLKIASTIARCLRTRIKSTRTAMGWAMFVTMTMTMMVFSIVMMRFRWMRIERPGMLQASKKPLSSRVGVI